MKLKKKDLCYVVFSIFVVFSDVLKNGNLNLLYIFGIVLLIRKIGQIKFDKDMLKLFIPLVLIVLIESTLGTDFEPIRVVAYFCKMLACISLCLFFENSFYRIDKIKFLDISSMFYAIFLAASIITINQEPLWRVNDLYNSISKMRLQFLYSEPSVLGLLMSVFLVIIFCEYLKTGLKKNLLIMGSLFLIILILTFSMSAILLLAISCSLILINNILHRKVKEKYLLIAVLGIVIIALIMVTDNPIHNRIIEILAGRDGSFNFRGGAAFSSMIVILKKTHWLGIGLTNMNTPNGLKLLSETGIDNKFADSFMYFVTENGIWGIAYILFLLFLCIRSYARCIKKSPKESNLKVGLISLWFFGQILGGYFTDPTLWCVFGIINANFADIEHENIKNIKLKTSNE